MPAILANVDEQFIFLSGKLMNNVSVYLLSLFILAGCAGKNIKEPIQPPTAKESASARPAENNSSTSNAQPTVNSSSATNSIYFDFDQSNVKDSFRPILESTAKYMKEHTDNAIILQGNSDERGSSEYNLALGNRRAESAKKILSVLGVNNKNIEIVSFGKEQPTALCHEEKCWAKNRRADIVLNKNN